MQLQLRLSDEFYKLKPKMKASYQEKIAIIENQDKDNRKSNKILRSELWNDVSLLPLPRSVWDRQRSQKQISAENPSPWIYMKVCHFSPSYSDVVVHVYLLYESMPLLSQLLRCCCTCISAVHNYKASKVTDTTPVDGVLKVECKKFSKAEVVL